MRSATISSIPRPLITDRERRAESFLGDGALPHRAGDPGCELVVRTMAINTRVFTWIGDVEVTLTPIRLVKPAPKPIGKRPRRGNSAR
jgi:hypothetical protein